MTKKITYLLMLVATAFLFTVSSCKSSKSVTEDSEQGVEIATSYVLQEMAQSYRTWDTFSTSGKISISGIASFSTSMQLKMSRGKCISISIRPLLGIEVAKVFIDKESATIIDKYHKTYTTIELKDLAHILPIDINDIQDILLARAFTLNDGTLSTENVNKFSISTAGMGNGYIVSPKKKNKDFTYEFLLNKDKQVEALNVYPSSSAKSYSAVYSDFATSQPGSEAANISVDTTIKDKAVSLNLYMNPSKTRWDAEVEESVSINKSYKEVTILELLKSLKSL